MGSIKIICYTSKTLAFGNNPIMIRITSDNERKYINTSLKCPAPMFNTDIAQASDAYRENRQKGIIARKLFNAELDEISDRINEVETTLGRGWKITEFIDAYHRKEDKVTALQFYDKRIELFVTSARIGNAVAYRNSKRSFNNFLKSIDRENLYFNELTFTMVEAYKGWLESRRINDSSIAIYMRTLRATYRSAIENNIATDKNCFKNGIIPSGDPLHRALKEIEFKAFCKVRFEDRDLEFAREIFLISYYLRGINLIDLAHMKVEQYDNGIITYQRLKTKRKKHGPRTFKIPVHKKIIHLVSKYAANKTKGEYLFPLINTKADTPQKIWDSIKHSRDSINKNLRSIAVMAGINKFTMYAARHTYAMGLMRKSKNPRLVQEAMGHSDASITESYLESFQDSELSDIIKDFYY